MPTTAPRPLRRLALPTGRDVTGGAYPDLGDSSGDEECEPLGAEEVADWLSSLDVGDCAPAEELHAARRQLDDAAVGPLAGALLATPSSTRAGFPELQCLDLSGNSLTDSACALLAECCNGLRQHQADQQRASPSRPLVPRPPGLQRLLLAGNQIGPGGAEVVAAAFFPRETSSGSSAVPAPPAEYLLSLSENPLGDEGVIALARVLSSSSILAQNGSGASLMLSGVGCGAAGCESLVHSLPRISGLDLGDNAIPAPALNVLVSGLHSGLRRLNLQTLVRRPTADLLAQAVSGRGVALSSLNLADSNLLDDGLKASLTALAATTAGLAELDVSGNKLSNGNLFANILAGPGGQQLVSLNVERNELNDLALMALAAGVSMSPRLRRLNLARNRIGDTGAEALAQAIKHQRDAGSKLPIEAGASNGARSAAVSRWLQQLHKRRAAGNSDARSAEVDGGPGLRHLDLSFNMITDQGAKALADAAAGTAKLRQLNLYDTSIGQAGRAALADALRARHSRVAEAVAAVQASPAGPLNAQWPLFVQGLGFETLDIEFVSKARAWASATLRSGSCAFEQQVTPVAPAQPVAAAASPPTAGPEDHVGSVLARARAATAAAGGGRRGAEPAEGRQEEPFQSLAAATATAVASPPPMAGAAAGGLLGAESRPVLPMSLSPPPPAGLHRGVSTESALSPNDLTGSGRARAATAAAAVLLAGQQPFATGPPVPPMPLGAPATAYPPASNAEPLATGMGLPLGQPQPQQQQPMYPPPSVAHQTALAAAPPPLQAPCPSQPLPYVPLLPSMLAPGAAAAATPSSDPASDAAAAAAAAAAPVSARPASAALDRARKALQRAVPAAAAPASSSAVQAPCGASSDCSSAAPSVAPSARPSLTIPFTPPRVSLSSDQLEGFQAGAEAPPVVNPTTPGLLLPSGVTVGAVPSPAVLAAPPPMPLATSVQREPEAQLLEAPVTPCGARPAGIGKGTPSPSTSTVDQLAGNPGVARQLEAVARAQLVLSRARTALLNREAVPAQQPPPSPSTGGAPSLPPPSPEGISRGDLDASGAEPAPSLVDAEAVRHPSQAKHVQCESLAEDAEALAKLKPKPSEGLSQNPNQREAEDEPESEDVAGQVMLLANPAAARQDAGAVVFQAPRQQPLVAQGAEASVPEPEGEAAAAAEPAPVTPTAARAAGVAAMPLPPQQQQQMSANAQPPPPASPPPPHSKGAGKGGKAPVQQAAEEPEGEAAAAGAPAAAVGGRGSQGNSPPLGSPTRGSPTRGSPSRGSPEGSPSRSCQHSGPQPPPPPPMAKRPSPKGKAPPAPKGPKPPPPGGLRGPKGASKGKAGNGLSGGLEKQKPSGPFQRKLYWKALEVTETEDTIFANPRDRAESAPKLDIDALTRMFDSEKKDSQRASKADTLLSKVQKKSIGTKLLSDHRARNIAIILKRMPVSMKDLVRILRELTWEASLLTTDDLEQILEVIPTQEEAERLREHRAPEARERLRDVEQLVLPLALLNRGAARVRLLVIARNFRANFNHTMRSLSVIRAGCGSVAKSARLKDVMVLALEMGNYINHGDSSKGAKAISVGSLMTLQEFKTGRMSSMHFLCASLLIGDPDCHMAEVLAKELRPALGASGVQVQTLMSGVRSMRNDLEIIKAENDNFLQEYAQELDGEGSPKGHTEDDDREMEELEAALALGSKAKEQAEIDEELADEDATRWVEDIFKIRGDARRRVRCMRRVAEKVHKLVLAEVQQTAVHCHATLRFCGVVPPRSTTDVPSEIEALFQQLNEFIKVFQAHWDEVSKELPIYRQLFSHQGASGDKAT